MSCVTGRPDCATWPGENDTFPRCVPGGMADADETGSGADDADLANGEVIGVADDDGVTAEPAGATTFRRTDVVLACQPLHSGVTAGDVAAVVETCRPVEPGGTEWLVDGDDVVTASLFLAADGPAVVWVLEVTDGARGDPAGEVVARSPLFDAGLDELLADDGSDRDPVDARELVVHAANPLRPGRPDDPDVVMVRLGVRPGAAALLARGLARAATTLLGTPLARPVERSATDLLVDERMWTETLWLEREGDQHVVRWYLEADDLAHSQEAFDANDSRVARWSEAVLDRVFLDDVDVVADPAGADGWTLLAHATDPERC